jgi:hypothetical protein
MMSMYAHETSVCAGAGAGAGDDTSDVALFMRPRRNAYVRIAEATRRVPNLPTGGSCTSAHMHALGVCDSKLALSNWLDALPFPLVERAVRDLQEAARVHVMNEPCRAKLGTETFFCHVCSHRMSAAYMDSHIAMHTCEMDRACLIQPRRRL